VTDLVLSSGGAVRKPLALARDYVEISMRLAIATTVMLLAAPAWAAGPVLEGLTIRLGAVTPSSLGTNVNFSITNADAIAVKIVFVKCTSLNKDGQPEAQEGDDVHNVMPGETAFGQAAFFSSDVTPGNHFSCRIDQISQ
jgi:hypothetical protein